MLIANFNVRFFMHIFLVFSNIIHSHICKKFKTLVFSINSLQTLVKRKVRGIDDLSAEAKGGLKKKKKKQGASYLYER